MPSIHELRRWRGNLVAVTLGDMTVIEALLWSVTRHSMWVICGDSDLFITYDTARDVRRLASVP